MAPESMGLVGKPPRKFGRGREGTLEDVEGSGLTSEVREDAVGPRKSGRGRKGPPEIREGSGVPPRKFGKSREGTPEVREGSRGP